MSVGSGAHPRGTIRRSCCTGRKRRWRAEDFYHIPEVSPKPCASRLKGSYPFLWVGVAVGLSTLLSQSINIILGFYFYGKKVFGVNNLSSRSALMYLGWAVLMWLANWSGIDAFSALGLSRNVSALLMIPVLACSSYIVQKTVIFPVTPSVSD